MWNRLKCRWIIGCWFGVLAVFLLCEASHAQLLTEKPQPAGGDLVGSWRIDKDPLKVYSPPEVAAAVNAQFSGETSGTLVLESNGRFQSDYITISNASVTVLGAPFELSVSDTNQFEGQYSVSGTQLILTPDDMSIAADTLAYTATSDSLHLVLPVPIPPGPFQDLAAALIPPDDPIVAVLNFVKQDTPVFTGPVTADFDGSGAVDFADFVSFVSRFGAASGDANYDVMFDLDGSGAIDFPDFLSFASQFGSTT